MEVVWPMDPDNHDSPRLDYYPPFQAVVPKSRDNNSSTRAALSLPSVVNARSPNYVDGAYTQGTLCPSYISQGVEPLAAPLEASTPRSINRDYGKGASSRFLCMWPGCESSFSRSADLSRHYNSVHLRPTSMVDCPKHRCTRKGTNGFPRLDHLKEHLRQYHGDSLPKAKHSKERAERLKLN